MATVTGSKRNNPITGELVNYATHTDVTEQIENIIDSAPSAMDTLNELAAALGDDPNFATTVTNNIAAKWTEDSAKLLNWDNAYSWGDHASAGYGVLTSDQAWVGNNSFTGYLSFGSSSSRLNGSDALPLVQVSNDRAYLGSTGRTSTTIASSDLLTHTRGSSEHTIHTDYSFGKTEIDALGIAATTASSATTATKLTSIGGSFSGEYPMTINAGGIIYSHSGVKFRGSDGRLTATSFSGDLVGNANTASFATSSGSAGNALTANKAYQIEGTTRWGISDTNNIPTYPVYYKVATVNKGNGGLHLKGTINNHVGTYGTCDFDLSIFGRANGSLDISIVGGLNVTKEGTGVLIVKSSNEGNYHNFDVYIALSRYSMVNVDLTPEGNTQVFSPAKGTGGTTTKPTGFSTKFDSVGSTQGSYVVSDSIITENYHAGNFGKTQIDALNVDADTLDGISSGSFLRSNTADTFTGTITGSMMHLGGSQITGSAAALQVNGFQRTGTIHLHEGSDPTTDNKPLSNGGGKLRWDGQLVGILSEGQTWTNTNSFSANIYANGDIVGNKATVVSGMFIGSNPEGLGNFQPSLINDIAYNTERGHAISVSGGVTYLNNAKDMFNGGASHASFNCTTTPTVIEFDIDRQNWGLYAGISFGNSNWTPHNCKLEVFSQNAWVVVKNTTDKRENVFGVVGGNSSTGATKMRITLSTSSGTVAARITHLWTRGYNSPMGRSLFLGRDGGDLYGDINVNGNKVFHEDNLSLSTLGYTGATDANNYVLPTNINLSGNLGASTVSATANLVEGGQNLSNRYLGKTAKALDADKLDGFDETWFSRYRGLLGDSNVAFGSTAGWPNNPQGGSYKTDYVGYSGLVMMSNDVSGSTSSIGVEFAYNGKMKFHSNTDGNQWHSHEVYTSQSLTKGVIDALDVHAASATIATYTTQASNAYNADNAANSANSLKLGNVAASGYMLKQTQGVYTAIQSGDWKVPALGQGTFAKSGSVGKPSGAGSGYWFNLGRRDGSAGGYAGIWVNDYQTAGSGAWLGRNDAGGDPTWEKIFTDKTLAKTDIDALNVHAASATTATNATNAAKLGNVAASGYQLKDDTAQFSYVAAPTDDWEEAIELKTLSDGTWIMEIFTNTSALGFYSCRWSATVAISSANSTNDDWNSEISLHMSGHANASNRGLYARTTMNLGATGKHLTLDIKVTKASTTTATYTIKFRKLI